MRSLMVEHMHPQGFIEMAASSGLLIAYAIAGFLDTDVSGPTIVRL